MSDVGRYMMERFVVSLIDNYTIYHQQHGVPYDDVLEQYRMNDTLNSFITYLIDHRLIEESTIKRYTILEEFAKIIGEAKHKTEAVETLSQRFNISKRTIWNIMKDHKGRFNSNT